jgi:RNA polymerase sigma-70 factor (ECF subfamily)
MSDELSSSTRLQLQLDRLNSGDETARDELLKIAYDRLLRLARKMLARYPGVQRWEQTDDVLQNAALRLWKSLRDVRPESVRSFINLAAVQIRRELIDLARHHEGGAGPGRPREGPGPRDGSASTLVPRDSGTDTGDPARLADWTEFHNHIEALPGEEKEIFDLLWYQGLTQAEAAAVLEVTERVVRYRWRAARLKLHEQMGDRLPR